MTIPRRKFASISYSVEKITKPIFGKRGFAEAAIVTDWSHIVGPTLASHTIPEKISFPRTSRTDGILKLKIDSSAMALELQHLSTQLIEKINTYFGYGAVSRIQIVQGPVPKREPIDEEPDQTPTDTLKSLNQKLTFVSDPDLRAALASLGGQLHKT